MRSWQVHDAPIKQRQNLIHESAFGAITGNLIGCFYLVSLQKVFLLFFFLVFPAEFFTFCWGVFLSTPPYFVRSFSSHFLSEAWGAALSEDSRAAAVCYGGGQLCSGGGSAPQLRAAWRVLSLFLRCWAPFGSHTLCHSEDRPYIHPALGTPAIVSLSWFEKPSGFFFFPQVFFSFLFFFAASASQGNLHLFQSWRFYRSIETGGYRTRHREFSSSSPSSSCSHPSQAPSAPRPLCFPRVQCVGRKCFFSARNQIYPENRSPRFRHWGFISLSHGM